MQIILDFLMTNESSTSSGTANDFFILETTLKISSGTIADCQLATAD